MYLKNYNFGLKQMFQDTRFCSLQSIAVFYLQLFSYFRQIRDYQSSLSIKSFHEEFVWLKNHLVRGQINTQTYDLLLAVLLPIKLRPSIFFCLVLRPSINNSKELTCVLKFFVSRTCPKTIIFKMRNPYLPVWCLLQNYFHIYAKSLKIGSH